MATELKLKLTIPAADKNGENLELSDFAGKMPRFEPWFHHLLQI